MTYLEDDTNIDPDTYYDFNKERFRLWVIGGFAIVKNPKFLSILNAIAIVCVGALYAYGLAAGLYTMLFVVNDKSQTVQTGYAFGLMFVSVGLRICRILSDESLKSVADLTRKGIFVYNEDFQTEYVEIKKKRIKQLKFLIIFISNGMFFCMFNFAIVIPIMEIFFGKEDTVSDESGLNPLLPLLIYIPFSTRNVLGFCIAYVTIFVLMVTIYSSFVCHEELYMCNVLQLTTEIEILNYSLRNLEKRALIRLRGKNILLEDYETLNDLYESTEFQKCLYMCLRENIIHHHAILRYKDAMRPYVEAATTLCAFVISMMIATAVVVVLQTNKPQLPSVTDIFGFLPMCWVGQLLVDESSNVINALFDTPWPNCNTEFKSLLKILMTNTQRPLTVKAKGVNIIIYLETFADMATLGYKLINVMR